MHEASVILKGAITGLAISASVGPVLLLSLQCTLKKSWLHGFIAGMGAAISDTFYCAFAVMSLSFVYSYLMGHSVMLRIIAGTVLVVSGIHMYITHKTTPHYDAADMRIGKEFIHLFVLGISNPMTMAGIIFIVSVLGGFGTSFTRANGVLFIVSFFLTTALWWLSFSLIAQNVKKMISEKTVNLIYHVSGIIVVALGIVMYLTAFIRGNKI